MPKNPRKKQMKLKKTAQLNNWQLKFPLQPGYIHHEESTRKCSGENIVVSPQMYFLPRKFLEASEMVDANSYIILLGREKRLSEKASFDENRPILQIKKKSIASFNLCCQRQRRKEPYTKKHNDWFHTKNSCLFSL